TSKYSESNASALDDLTLCAGNPVKEVLIMNLPDHRMPPKRTSTSEAPAMTQAAIKKLVSDSVFASLEAQAAQQYCLVAFCLCVFSENSTLWLRFVYCVLSQVEDPYCVLTKRNSAQL
ncbi:hypothetical protein Tco_0829534, partial [Tanacetum coccineum]